MKKLSLFLLTPVFLLNFSFPNFGKILEIFKKTPQIDLNRQVTLTYWGLFESEEVIKPLIDEYEATHPNIKIVYELKDYNDVVGYKDTVTSRLKNNTAPDIIRIHSTWIQALYPYLQPAPQKVFTKDSYNKEFFPAATDNCVSAKGDVYAVPLMYEAMVVFYNQDIMSEEGISKLPRTWDDFRELAIRLTKKDERGNITRAGAALGEADNIAHSSDILGLMFAQSGIRIPQDLDSETAAKTLDYYISFSRETKVWESWLPYSPIALSEGKVAMIFGPTWQSFTLLKGNPKASIGIAAVPQIPYQGSPNITDINWASFWVEAVPKNGKNSAAAWDFLKYLSSYEQRQKIFKTGSRIRPFGAAFGLSKLSETLKNENYINNVVLGAPRAKTGVIADRVGNDVYAGAINNAIREVLSGKSSKDALFNAKKTILEAQQVTVKK